MMEYSQKPMMNTAPAAMQMPMNMPMPNMVSPISGPMPNMVSPISAPMMKPPHHGHVSVNFVNMPVEEHCCPKGPAYSSTGVILVLFILLVIISRAKC
ncbi:MAG: hypothetical protein K0R28_7192 [Paenibacillus sp.]|nr:hypothetical protein [Paenibacillus sp.]